MVNNLFWIKFYQNFIEWRWYQDETVKSLYIHCLLKAYVKDVKIGNVVIPRGSFITSSFKLAEELGTTRQRIRTALEKLVSTNEITTKSTNRKTIINVVNYAIYQDIKVKSNQLNNQLTNQQLTNYQPTDNQLATKNNNYIYNNIKDNNIKDNNIKDNKKERKKDKENVLDKSNTKRKLETDTKVKTYFQKPTIEEIKKYCDERNNKVDPEAFWHFYESKGWKVGNVSMKSWKSAIVTWEKGNKNNSNKGGRPDAKPDWLDEYVKENGGK